MVFSEIGLDMKLKLIEMGYDSRLPTLVTLAEAEENIKKIIENGRVLLFSNELTNVNLETNTKNSVNALGLYDKPIIIYHPESSNRITFASANNLSIFSRGNATFTNGFSFGHEPNSKPITFIERNRDYGTDILNIIFNPNKKSETKIQIYGDTDNLLNFFSLNRLLDYKSCDNSYWHTIIEQLDIKCKIIDPREKHTEALMTNWYQITTNHATIEVGTYGGEYIIEASFKSKMLPEYWQKLFKGINIDDVEMDGKHQRFEPDHDLSIKSGKKLVIKTRPGNGMEIMKYISRLLTQPEYL